MNNDSRFANQYNIQWFPGHMTKTLRMMETEIQHVDASLVLLDARIPLSSLNPEVERITARKPKLYVLNKADLADERQNDAWAAFFQEKGYFTAKVNARSGAGMKKIQETIQEACKEKIERDRRRGIMNRPVRAMVVGIPNAGKSTFINTLAGKASAKTGNKPGVTKGKQWIRLNKSIELLDTPGILWPKFEDQMVGLRLAVVGSIKDELLQAEELALWLLGYTRDHYPGLLQARYQIPEEGSELELLGGIANARGCKLKGDLPDYPKAAVLFIDDFRSGRLGRLTLEQPPACPAV